MQRKNILSREGTSQFEFSGKLLQMLTTDLNETLINDSFSAPRKNKPLGFGFYVLYGLAQVSSCFSQ